MVSLLFAYATRLRGFAFDFSFFLFPFLFIGTACVATACSLLELPFPEGRNCEWSLSHIYYNIIYSFT